MRASFSTCFSTACFPGYDVHRAIETAQHSVASDPVLGQLTYTDVQLCPQNCIEIFDELSVDRLTAQYPETRFRLHANVRVFTKHYPGADLSAYFRYPDYFKRLAELSRRLNAPAYTLHAGRRTGRWETLLDNRKRLEDMFDVPVGIEGLYPVSDSPDYYWLSSWSEYRRLLDADIPFALDLSHLNIVAHYSGKIERTLTEALLSSPNCIEIHCSSNNGQKDSHQCLTSAEDSADAVWWLPLLNALKKETRAVVFFEGNLKKIQKSQT